MFNLIMKGLLATLHYTTLHYTSILYLVSPLPCLPFQLSCGGQRDWDWIPAGDRSAPRRPQGRAIGQGGRGACDRFLHVLIAIRRPGGHHGAVALELRSPSLAWEK